MNIDDVLLIDVGGTNTRIARHHGRLEILDVFPSDRQKLLDAVKKLGRFYRNCSLAVAGPVLDGSVKVTFNDFSLFRSDFSSFQRFLMLNDYEAGAHALGEMDYESLSSEPIPGKTQLLLGVGTGLGTAIRINGEVSGTEASFSTMYPKDEDTAEYFEWRQRKSMPIDMHHLLARNSTSEILGYVYSEDLKWSPEVADRFFNDKRARSLWENLLGRAMQELSFTYMPSGGIFLTGGVIHRYRDNINWDNVMRYFKNHDILNKELNRTPVSILQQDPTLEGCYQAYKKLYI